MNPFSGQHVAVLRALQTVWEADQFIVIGAAAIARHLEFRWRSTIDLDLSVAVAPETWVRDLEGLGWRRAGGALQRWVVPDGSLVDILPGNPILVGKGAFTWPDGSTRLNLVGFRLAFADAQTVALAPDGRVRVASLRSLVVLKMAAYLDLPWERDNDLADLVHVLSEFLGPDAGQRWSDEIGGLSLDFEDVGPFVIGKQLDPLVDDAERSLVERFLAVIDDPDDRLATLDRMARSAPPGWRDPDRLRRRWIAFRRGFQSSSK